MMTKNSVPLRSRVLRISVLLGLLVISFLCWNQWKLERRQKDMFSLIQTNPSKNVSVIVQQHAKHKAAKHPGKLVTFTSQAPKVAEVSREPSPMDDLSEDELARFPGATLVDAAEEEGPEDGQKTRVRILDTHFKYPYIRTEEVIDANNGHLVAREEMVADHLLVNLPQGQSPAAFMRNFGPGAVSMERVTPDAPLYRLKVAGYSPEALPWALDQVIANGKSVTIDEPDYVHHVELLPDNTPLDYRWGFLKVYDGLDTGKLWNQLGSAEPVKIALIDSGIRSTHQDLGDVVTEGWNAFENNSNSNDENGHGTHCAGIIGAVGKNAFGIQGVLPKARLMPFKAFDENGNGVTSDEIPCIDYALHSGAQLLNCSWGGSGFSQGLYDVLNRARSSGVVCITGAGNDALNDDEYPFYPAAFSVENPAGASLDNVVAVAATTQQDEIAPFSNYGKKSIQLAAPGVNICSTYAQSDDSYAYASGTSMAVPYVTSALAILKMQSPLRPYREQITLLFDTADKSSDLEDKVTYGRLNINKAIGTF